MSITYFLPSKCLFEYRQWLLTHPRCMADSRPIHSKLWMHSGWGHIFLYPVFAQMAQS